MKKALPEGGAFLAVPCLPAGSPLIFEGVEFIMKTLCDDACKTIDSVQGRRLRHGYSFFEECAGWSEVLLPQ